MSFTTVPFGITTVPLPVTTDGTVLFRDSTGAFWTFNISSGGVYQPLNANLTAISALTTQSYGLGLLQMGSAAAARAYLGIVPTPPTPPGSGTVTYFSFVGSNGIVGTVTNPATTPQLSLSLGAITPTSISTGTGAFTTVTATSTGPVFSSTGASVGSRSLNLANTTADAYFGIGSSIANLPFAGVDANATFILNNSTLPIQFVINGSQIAQFTTSGLQINGTIIGSQTITLNRTSGTFAAGDSVMNLIKVTSDGHAGGTTGEVIGLQTWLASTGTQNIFHLVGSESVAEVGGTAGTVGTAIGSITMAYLSNAASTTNAAAISAFMVLGGSGNITSNVSFFDASAFFATSTGDAIGAIQGFLCENVGRAAAVNGVTCFYAADQTPSTLGPTIGFRSLLSAGTNTWAIYCAGTAKSYMAADLQVATGVYSAGHIGIGNTTTAYDLDITKAGSYSLRLLDTSGGGNSLTFTTNPGMLGDASISSSGTLFITAAGTTGYFNSYGLNNIDIGTFSPKVGAFTSLTASGNVLIGNTSGNRSLTISSTDSHALLFLVPGTSSNAYITNSLLASTLYLRTSTTTVGDNNTLAVAPAGIIVNGSNGVVVYRTSSPTSGGNIFLGGYDTTTSRPWSIRDDSGVDRLRFSRGGSDYWFWDVTKVASSDSISDQLWRSASGMGWNIGASQLMFLNSTGLGVSNGTYNRITGFVSGDTVLNLTNKGSVSAYLTMASGSSADYTMEMATERTGAGAGNFYFGGNHVTQFIWRSNAYASLGSWNASGLTVNGEVIGTSKATGSVTQRSFANRFAQVVNVLDYGADPTGAANSDTALSAALAALPVGGPIQYIWVDETGSGYTSVPTVTFSAGAGAATAIVKDQKVVAIVVTTRGSYATPPTIGFSGGGGSGATAYAIIGTPCCLYFPQGTYQNTGITLPANVGCLDIIGDGAKLYNTSVSNSCIAYPDSVNMTRVKGLTLMHQPNAAHWNASRDAGCGIRLKGRFHHISDLFIYQSPEFGINIGDDTGAPLPCRFVTIENVTVEDTFGDGIHAQFAQDVLVANCTARNTGDDSFAAVNDSSATAYCNRIKFSNCKVYNSYRCGLRIESGQNIDVENLTVIGSGEPGIKVIAQSGHANAENITISNCSIRNPYNYSGTLGRGITLAFDGGGGTINKVRVTGCTVSDTTAAGGGGQGLYASSSGGTALSNILICGNNFMNIGDSNYIFTQGMTGNNTVRNNSCSDSGKAFTDSGSTGLVSANNT